MIEPRHRHLRGIAALPTAGTARTLLRMQTTCRQRSVAVCRLTPLSAPRLAPGSGRRGPPHVQPPATHPPQGGCKLTSRSQDRTARRSHSAHRDVAAAHRSHHAHKQHNETPLQIPPRGSSSYLSVALSPCRTVTLSIALGKVASPLRTGTPAGTRKSSLRQRTTRHLQGRAKHPPTPILGSRDFSTRQKTHPTRPPGAKRGERREGVRVCGDGGEQNHRGGRGGERCGAPRRSGEPLERQPASTEPAERHPEGVPSILG